MNREIDLYENSSMIASNQQMSLPGVFQPTMRQNAYQ